MILFLINVLLSPKKHVYSLLRMFLKKKKKEEKANCKIVLNKPISCCGLLCEVSSFLIACIYFLITKSPPVNLNVKML